MWYLHCVSDFVLRNPSFYDGKFNVGAIPQHEVLILDISHPQQVHPNIVSPTLKVHTNLELYRLKHTNKGEFYFHSIEMEMKDNNKENTYLIVPLSKLSEHDHAGSDDEDFVPSNNNIRVTVPFANDLGHTKFDRIKSGLRQNANEFKNMIKNGQKIEINLLDDDEDDDMMDVASEYEEYGEYASIISQIMNIASTHSNVGRPIHNKSSSGTRAIHNKSSNKNVKPRKHKRNSVKSVRGKRKKKLKPKMKTRYKQYLKIAIENNKKYLREKEVKGTKICPYPHRITDHASTPSMVIRLIFFVLWMTFGIDARLMDVVPLRSSYDFCDYALWLRYDTLFINPPWSCPWWYIIESVKYLEEKKAKGEMAMVVLLLCRATNKKYWQELLCDRCLTIDVSSITFGGYNKKAPMITSLVFLSSKDIPKTDPLKLGFEGNVDIEKWSEEMKCKDNSKLLQWLDHKYKYDFLPLDVDLC
eukprot:235313_1